MNAIRLASICPCKAGKLMFLGRPLASLLLIVLLLKAVHVIGLVPTCRCKGGRFMAFRKAFGIVTCPLLFFTLPRSLGRPAYYSSLLDLVFFSYEDCECHTASTYMSLQGWQADVFRQALSLSSAYCASSEGCNRDRASIYICHLSSYIFFGRPSAWYSSLLDLVFFSSEGCECDRARNYIYIYVSLQGWLIHVMWDGLWPSTFFFLSLPPLVLKVVNLIELVSICQCKGDRFIFLRKAFGVVLFSS